jgi:hypothetical protein
MLSALALVAIAAGMAICVGSVGKLWLDSRKQETKSDDGSCTDVEC